MGFKIEDIWLFVSVGHDGDEGVCAFQVADGWMPMVAADEKRLEQLKPIAARLAQSTGQTVQLKRFESSRVIDSWPREET